MVGVGWAAFSFRLKAAAGVGLVGLAELALFGHLPGATLGGFALAWLGTTVALRPATWRDGRAVAAAAMAALYAGLMVDRPTLAGWALFWTALSVAALSPRTGSLPGVGAWGRRLAIHVWVSLTGPGLDAARLQRLWMVRGGAPSKALLPTAILALGGGALFLGLFTMANPLIAEALSHLSLLRVDLAGEMRLVFGLMVLMAVWASLRPPRRPRGLRAGSHRPTKTGDVLRDFRASGGSVAPALILFNVLFAIENGLDLAFLWSGLGPPAGVTLAQYAHRGAYPLIVTALLAGGFSLVLLREGSPLAERPLIRRLVGLWVAQNVLLSASSILRTLDYVQAYSLTRFRLAALLWMVLVMTGLALIGWRILRRKSGVWLLNANGLALGVALTIASVADLGSVAAWWNVRHAREIGRTGAEVDVCYLEALGSPALLPLLELEREPVGLTVRARARFVRRQTYDALVRSQADWRNWTWRGARRLAAARTEAARLDLTAPSPPAVIGCGGELPRPPASGLSVAGVASSALTPGAQP